MFEPVLYDEISYRKHDLIDVSTEEYVVGERIDEEFDFWLERFGKIEEDLFRPPSEYFEEFQEGVEELDNEGVDTVVAPAVSGIPWGIIARDMLEANNFGIVGYSEKHGGKSREVASNTLEESDGDVLIPDDTVSSGSSIAGIADNIDNQDSSTYVVEAKGTSYELVERPKLWKVKEMLNKKPDKLLVNGENGIVDEEVDYKIDIDIRNAGMLIGSTALMTVGLAGLKSGDTNQILFSYMVTMGLFGFAEEVFDQK